jgi:hypothetical protein
LENGTARSSRDPAAELAHGSLAAERRASCWERGFQISPQKKPVRPCRRKGAVTITGPGASEVSNEYYADMDTPKEIIEAYFVDQSGKVRKITDPDELAQMKDTRSFEDQRNCFILNRIWDRLNFDHKVYINRDVLSQLVTRCFAISFVYPNRLETSIIDLTLNNGYIDSKKES